MVERDAGLRTYVSDYVHALERHVRVDRLILFGSRARGDASPASDMDLLVVSPDLGKSILQDIDLLRGCLPPHTEGVDVLGCTPGDLAAAEPGDVVSEALREGVAVYRSAAPSSPEVRAASESPRTPGGPHRPSKASKG